MHVRYLSQTLSFRKPVYAGEELVATVVVKRLRGHNAQFETSVVNITSGEIVVDGVALALLPEY